MKNRQLILKLIALVIFVGGCATLFQNCSGPGNNPVSFSSRPQQLGPGDGEGWDGKPKPGNYYRIIPGYTCSETSSIFAELEISETKTQLKSIDPVDCKETTQELAPNAVEFSPYNKATLGYEDGIYERYESAPNPQDPTLKLPESWCRTESQANMSSLDLLIHDARAQGELSVLIVGATSPAQTYPISKSFDGQKLTYHANGLTLSVDYPSGTTSSQKNPGHLSMLQNGQMLEVAVTCRSGGWLDPQQTTQPSFMLNLSSETLPESISFARNSPATYFDASGMMKTVASDQPRFEFSRTTHLVDGLLIEPSATNLLTFSEQIEQANWVKRTY